MKPFSKDKMLRYADASELTGIGIDTLYAYVCKKLVPHYRIGGRLVLFSKNELLEWMNLKACKPKEEPKILKRGNNG